MTPDEVARVSKQTETGLGTDEIAKFGDYLKKTKTKPTQIGNVTDSSRIHAHHIVMKDGGSTTIQGGGRLANDMSKDILAKHGIDWYADTENLTWAINHDHIDDYANAVNRLLTEADELGGKKEVIKALDRMKDELAKGNLIR